MLAYKNDELIRFFKYYKTIEEMFEAIKVRCNANAATYV